MAIQRSYKQSDLEKRLQLLRRQVYGKENVSGIRYQVSGEKETSVVTHNTDISYLHQDLFKILTLSSLAIGVQLILFILLKNHVLNLSKLLLSQ